MAGSGGTQGGDTSPPAGASGPAPAALPAGAAGTAGTGLSPADFGTNPFVLRSGTTVGALTPFVVSSGMAVPAAQSGNATTTAAGTDANGVGYTATTIDSYSFAASLAPDAAGGLAYTETYSFSYDVQTVPAAAGGAAVHDWAPRATPSSPTTTAASTPSPSPLR